MRRKPLHSLPGSIAVGALIAAFAVVVAMMAGAGNGLSEPDLISLGGF